MAWSGNRDFPRFSSASFGIKLTFRNSFDSQFKGGTNLFLNGIVLATIYYGGCLMAAEKVSPGDLMSFLVATQTIQRSVGQVSLLLGQYVKGKKRFCAHLKNLTIM